jgi:hypothetical protein
MARRCTVLLRFRVKDVNIESAFGCNRSELAPDMMCKVFLSSIVFLSFLFSASYSLIAQQPAAKSIEVSDEDGVPVLVKHLPQWETVRARAVLTSDLQSLKNAVGQQPVLEQIEFIPATEAVTAPYDAGRLVIIEYPSPQWSTEMDNRVTRYSSENGGGFAYRRIGNYNAFVFDPASAEAAAALLDQIKYEKNIQWLGRDPFAQNRAERHFVVTTSDIFLSTVLVIILGMVISIIGGLIAGAVFFMLRERRRAGMSEYSDAGGMTRLNLDSLTPNLYPRNFLND